MNLKELKQYTAQLLNFNPRQVNQDFTQSQLLTEINRAYAREVANAAQEGGRRYFQAQQEFTWPLGQLRLVLPTGISQKSLLRLIDVTNSQLGYDMQFSDSGLNGQVFWLDHNTLQYGAAGPGLDVQIRAVYYGQAQALVQDLDIPELIPSPYDELIAWSAACNLRRMADEGVPPEWAQRLMELQIDYWKVVSRGRPDSDTPWVSPSQADLRSNIFFY